MLSNILHPPENIKILLNSCKQKGKRLKYSTLGRLVFHKNTDLSLIKTLARNPLEKRKKERFLLNKNN